MCVDRQCAGCDQCGQDAAPLFAVDEEGNVDFVDADEELPSSGTLVTLSPP